jgi:hypothetical protein
MAWRDERQLLIGGTAFVILATVVSLIAFVTLSGAPSCLDGKQNQDERGVDCGGSCPRVCEEDARAPIVKFARLLPQGNRYDLIVHLENRQPQAKNTYAVFTVEAFGSDGAPVFQKDVTTSLSPQPTIPIFIPNIAPQLPSVSRVFVSLKDLGEFTQARSVKVPSVTSYTLTTVRDAPRLIAHITGEETLYNTTFVATVFVGDDIVAATQTIVPILEAGKDTELIFTWLDPFPQDGARVIILPASP